MKVFLDKQDLLKQKKIVKINLIFDIITVVPVIVIAVLSNSLVMLSEIFDYVLVLSSELFALFILRRCINNETGKYEFGFGKMESLSAIITSLVMLVGLLYLAYEAFSRIWDTQELNDLYILIGILIYFMFFVVNFYLWRLAYKQFQEKPSPIIDAQWRVNRMNTIGSIGVAIALALYYYFREYDWSAYIDPVFAIIFGFLSLNQAYGACPDSQTS